MSPKRLPAKIKETRIALPAAIHDAARVKAAGAGMSLRAWLASLAAREVGMGKAYRAPERGGDRYSS